MLVVAEDRRHPVPLIQVEGGAGCTSSEHGQRGRLFIVNCGY